MSKYKNIIIVSGLIVIAVILIVINLFVGIWSHFSNNDLFKTILIELRLPRIIAAVLTGMALSISGMQMQAVFRNPLAGPYILGISSGAALMVALLTMTVGFFGLASIISISYWGVVFAAGLGSFIFLFIIYSVYLRLKQPVTVLIAGVLLGSAAGAIVNILQYFSSEKDLKVFVVWTMGSLSSITWNQLYVFIAVVLIAVVFSFFLNNALNVLRAGDDYASSLGVKVHLARTLSFVSTGLLTGTVLAFCGPIAFIGVAVPHITRLIFGTSNHRIIFTGVILVGAIVMLFADLLSRLIIPDTQLPINSITSLIGIPVVLWVLFKGRKIMF